MDFAEFEEVFEAQIERSRKVLIEKAKEYATEDRLHNFKIASEIRGTSLKDALSGMMVKHTTSLYDMINSDQEFVTALWDEKITDHINYLILLRAIIQEETNDRVQSNAQHGSGEDPEVRHAGVGG